MEKTIWKFNLALTDGQNIMIPKGAEILCVKTQPDIFGEQIPYLWALVDPEQPVEGRFIAIFGTGHTILYDSGVEYKYIDTVMTKGGKLVWHVFEYTGV